MFQELLYTGDAIPGSIRTPRTPRPLLAGLYKPNVKIEIQRGKYTIKTAVKISEVFQALSLRYQIFHREFGGSALPFGIDISGEDLHADHLIILDESKGKVIGTYRIRCSKFVDSFYSETEFDIGYLLSRARGVKTELSRACIDPQYRNGSTMSMLWRGVSAYIKATQTAHLFGCSSIKLPGPDAVANIMDELESLDAIDHSMAVFPLMKNQPPLATSKAPTKPRSSHPRNDVELPGLLRTYLRLGCKVAANPAYDAQFDCYDFFTHLEIEKIDAGYREHFLGAGPSA
jgi:putative hemolysin